jgi:hypothetical protein
VFRIRVFAPLGLLEPADALSVDQVGPGTRHRGRPNRSMKINQHLALRCLATDLVIKVHDRLIVTLHEINLYTFDAPFLELIEGGFELIIERLPNHPENYPDVFLSPVSNQFLDIHFRNDLQQVSQLVPTFIENDVLDAVL